MTYTGRKINLKNISISRHAYDRMKERNGWSKKAATRMLDRIYMEGLRPNQVKGYLKGWVNYRANKDGYVHAEYILFGERLYIFIENVMVTVIQVPTRGFIIPERVCA